MINVTKTFLPPLEDYIRLLEGVWERGHITNHGPLVNQLEEDLRRFLGVGRFSYVANGTIALQIALRALDVKGRVITTPFSYVATTSTIVWEHATPIFVDIDPRTLNIDPTRIEAAITPDTTAILAPHVYGIPCDVHALATIAARHGLKVIYDAAHAFGVKLASVPLLTFGDVSTVSFHATKLFHTAEGGGIVASDPDVAHRVSYMRNFGHHGQEEYWGLGINAKCSELHAALGLTVLPHVHQLIARRRALSDHYDACLSSVRDVLRRPERPQSVEYNYAYYPVIFEAEHPLLAVRQRLNEHDVFPRRYFYPPLNRLPYVDDRSDCPVSDSVSQRVLCLPLAHSLTESDIERISGLIVNSLDRARC